MSRANNNATWPQHRLCSSQVIKALLCYDVSGLPAEGQLASALPLLHQLCAIQNGMSTGGECSSAACNDCSALPPCSQTNGVGNNSRFFISFYVVIGVFLWEFSTSIATPELFSRERSSTLAKLKTDSGPKYTRLLTKETDSLDSLSLDSYM